MSEKRVWSSLSPHSDSDNSLEKTDKRGCFEDVEGDNNSNSFLYNESTLVEDPLTSTRVESSAPSAPSSPVPEPVSAMPAPGPAPPAPTPSLPASLQDLMTALTNPAFLDVIADAVAARVSDRIDKRIGKLEELLTEKDRQISDLTARLDSLEQYSRRNSVRITGIPERKTEDTDDIAIAVAKVVGLEGKIDLDSIDRSHRVGPPGAAPRPVIVKFTSYRYKSALMRARKNLKNRTAADVLRGLHGPTTDRPADRPSGLDNKVFINDDLTTSRARLATEARKLKKAGRVQDTWTFDGTVFIKKNNRVVKINNNVELQKL